MDRSKRSLKPPVRISILEKDENEVSHCWKTCQLFSYVLVVISGIGASMSVGNIQKMFKGECIMYANLAVNVVNNWSLSLDNDVSHNIWGDATTCSYCQFCPVASVVFAAIWATLFIMCGHGGYSSRNLPQPWRIVPPAILFNFIFLILSSVNAALTFGGFSTFCSNIQSHINITGCEDLIDFAWNQYPNASNFYDDMVIAETGAAIGVIGWLLGFAVLLIRIFSHADFHVVSRSRHLPSSPSSPPSQSTTSTSISTASNSLSSSPLGEASTSVIEPLVNTSRFSP